MCSIEIEQTQTAIQMRWAYQSNRRSQVLLRAGERREVRQLNQYSRRQKRTCLSRIQRAASVEHDPAYTILGISVRGPVDNLAKETESVYRIAAW